MPNWTRSIAMMRAEDLDAAVNADGDFDFGLIRPMPESLMVAEGSRADLAIAAAMAKRSGDGEAFEAAVRAAGLPWDACPDSTLRGHGCAGPDGLVALGEAYLRNIEEHGFRSWYGWCREHWGTKWNARDTAIEDCGGYKVAEFYTAGARPSLEMLGELAAGNGAPIWMEWADDDFDGVHCALLRPDGGCELFGEPYAIALRSARVADVDCGEWVDACRMPVAEADIARRLALGRGEDAATRYAAARS